MTPGLRKFKQKTLLKSLIDTCQGFRLNLDKYVHWDDYFWVPFDNFYKQVSFFEAARIVAKIVNHHNKIKFVKIHDTQCRTHDYLFKAKFQSMVSLKYAHVTDVSNRHYSNY